MDEGTHMYSQTAHAVVPAPTNRSTDPAIWAIVALVAAIVAAGLGWAVAQSQRPSWNDATQVSALARQEGQLRGQQQGYRDGSRLGRKEAQLQARVSSTRAQRASFAEGYRAGVQQGRATARAQRGSGLDTYGMAASPLMSESIDDLIASSDVPLTSSSYELSSPAGYGTGYGAGTGIPGYDATSSSLYEQMPFWRR